MEVLDMTGVLIFLAFVAVALVGVWFDRKLHHDD
jgi:hypothetical protein